MKNREDIQKEALSKIIGYRRAGINMSMGTGKTKILLDHFKEMMFNKPLIVVPKVKMKDNWNNEIKKFNSNITPEYSTYRSLTNVTLNDYDVIYLDECHNLLAHHKDHLKNYKGCIIGATGTMPSDKDKLDFINECCPIKYEYTTTKAVDNKILNDYSIVIHLLELNTEKEYRVKTKSGKSWFTSEFLDYHNLTDKVNTSFGKSKQFMAIRRMTSMKNYPTKEIYAKKLFNSLSDKTIIFANTIEQAERLCKNSYNSKNKGSDNNLQLFSDSRITKLSAVDQLNEGINIPDLKEGIIMHSYASPIKSSQRIGRLLRLNPNDKSRIHILCYKDTIDEIWVKQALLSHDQNRIKWVESKNYLC